MNLEGQDLQKAKTLLKADKSEDEYSDSEVNSSMDDESLSHEIEKSEGEEEEFPPLPCSPDRNSKSEVNKSHPFLK